MNSIASRRLHQRFVDALYHYATQDGLAPVCFALVDAQGELLCFERMEGAPVRTINIAIAKAYTAAKMGCHTQQFRQRLQNENLRCSEFMDSKLCALPGGVIQPLYDQHTVALGISGRALDEDQKLALLLAEHVYREHCQP